MSTIKIKKDLIDLIGEDRNTRVEELCAKKEIFKIWKKEEFYSTFCELYMRLSDELSQTYLMWIINRDKIENSFKSYLKDLKFSNLQKLALYTTMVDVESSFSSISPFEDEYCNIDFVKEAKLRIISKNADYICKNLFGKESYLKSTYDFHLVKTKIDSLQDIKERVEYIDEILCDFEHDYSWQTDDVELMSYEDNFFKKCEVEKKRLINRLNSSDKYDQIGMHFQLTDRKGARLDLIRIIKAICDIKIIESNGIWALESDLMLKIGNFFGIDLLRYDKDMASAFKGGLETKEKNTKIFKQLSEAIEKALLKIDNKDKL